MVKRNTEFPKVKGLYKKRTAAGVRYVLRGTKKDGGKMVDLFVTVPLEPDDSDRVFYEKVQKAREELDAKINPVKDIAYYIDQYACKRTLSQGSAWQYNHALKGFNLNADNDERMVAEILARTDLKDTSKKRMIGIVNTFYKYLVQIGVVKRNPAAGIRIGRWQRRTRIPTDAEVERILTYTDTNGNEADALFLRLIRDTGARCSSVEILRICDMSDDWHLSLYNVKTRKPYSVSILITDPVVKQLWKSVAGNRDPMAHIFGEGIEAKRVTRRLGCRMQRLFEPDADGQRISIHSFRHRFGCQLIEKGTPITTIASLMDHQSASVTYQYYARPAQSNVDDAMRLLGSFNQDSDDPSDR